MDDIRFCSYCGTKRDGINRFCTKCGRQLTDVAISPSFATKTNKPSGQYRCPKCDKHFNEKLAVCPGCGTDLAWDNKKNDGKSRVGEIFEGMMGITILTAIAYLLATRVFFRSASPEAISPVAEAIPASVTVTIAVSPTATPPPIGSWENPYPSGTDVTIGQVRWRITHSEIQSTLPKSYGGKATAQGKFVVVNAQVENLSDSPRTVRYLDLMDGKGRRFNASEDSYRIKPPTIAFEDLNPNMPFSYSTVFDVPTDAYDLTVTISDLAFVAPQTAHVLLSAARGSKYVPTPTPTSAEPRLVTTALPSTGTPSLDYALATLLDHGYTAVDHSQWHPEAQVRVLIGESKGKVGPAVYHAFFFYNGDFAGLDTPESDPSQHLTLASQDGTTITLEYGLYRSGDAACCPSGGTSKVRFVWDGTKIMALDPRPSSNPEEPLSRR